MKKIIIREYIESLKEDDELDYIFPLLLEVLDFRIITTPKEYKGTSQYGKDIIAIGHDPKDDIRKVFYFELKGGQDKNLTATTFSKQDGIRESLIEAKDATYKDESIPELKTLPIKVVLVHNGTMHPNVKQPFNGFIEREFSQKKRTRFEFFFGLNKNKKPEFERWDTYKLTELFEDSLFNEYLLTDDESIKIFKKMLVLFNVPENDQMDFYILVNHLLDKFGNDIEIGKSVPRRLIKLFESFRLLGFISFSQAKEANNIAPSRKCISYLVLRVWGWILENEWQGNTKIIKLFNKIYELLTITLEEYFKKTIPVALLKDGLYYNSGGQFEQIGYPIRAIDYLGYLIFYFQISIKNDDSFLFKNDDQIDSLEKLITLNSGTYRPLLDNHSIPIVSTILFLLKNKKKDLAKKYILNVFNSLVDNKELIGFVPDGKNNIESVVQFVAGGYKTIYYEGKTSILIGSLFELLSLLDLEDDYTNLASKFSDLDLCVFIPFDDESMKTYLPSSLSPEITLFKQGLDREGYQSEVALDSDFNVFKDKTKNKNEMITNLNITRNIYPELIYLAQFIYGTPVFPHEWRKLIS